MAQNGRANAADGTPTFEECEDPARTLWRDRQESTSGTQRQRRRVAADATLNNGCSTSLARTRPDVDTAVRVLASRFASPVEKVPPAHGNELIQGVATRAQPVETMSPAGSNELIRRRGNARSTEACRMGALASSGGGSFHGSGHKDPAQTGSGLGPARDGSPCRCMRPREVVLLPPISGRPSGGSRTGQMPLACLSCPSTPCRATQPSADVWCHSSNQSATQQPVICFDHISSFSTPWARHNSASGTSRPNSMKK